MAASVERGPKRQSDGAASAKRNFPATPVVYINGESLSI